MNYWMFERYLKVVKWRDSGTWSEMDDMALTADVPDVFPTLGVSKEEETFTGYYSCYRRGQAFKQRPETLLVNII